MKNKLPELDNKILMLSGIVLAFASFLLFQELLSGKASNFTSEISAAFLGSLLTIIITAIMLNKQSDVDMRKDRSAKMLEKKIDFYDKMMEELQKILCKKDSEFGKDEIVTVQILNQRMAYIAGDQVVEAFAKFATLFAEVAEDGILDDSDKNRLLNEIAMISVKMRLDILTREEKLNFNEVAFRDLVMNSTKSLNTKKSTKEEFIELCEEDEKQYFNELIKFINENSINLVMGTKGFSIKDNNKKAVIWCFPSNSKQSIQILMDNSSENYNQVVEYLKKHNVKLNDDSKRVSIKTTDMPVENLKVLVRIMVPENKN